MNPLCEDARGHDENDPGRPGQVDAMRNAAIVKLESKHELSVCNSSYLLAASQRRTPLLVKIALRRGLGSWSASNVIDKMDATEEMSWHHNF